jgi:hypothetical protein
MSYQKARLWLGISGVGTLVVIAATAILFDLPRVWSSDRSDAEVIGSTIAIYILLSAPFDWLGGLILPRAFGQKCDSVSGFAPRWLRGVFIQAGVMTLALMTILAAGKAGGLTAATVTFVSFMVLLVFTQELLARWVGGIKDKGPDNSNRHSLHTNSGHKVRIYQAADPGFTGGIVGPPGSETIIIPAHWLTRLKPWMKQTLLLRRQTVIEARTRSWGLALAILWNLVGFLLAASYVPGADVETAAGLISLSLGAGLWNFIGLLLLPTPSRSAVMATDRQVTASSNETARTLSSALRAIHNLQGDEPRRGRWIERVFHPIPALEHRTQLLDGSNQDSSGGKDARVRPWHLARTALFLSWACFGFLSRAVHCNSGRPDLWVMLPSD